jgi:magnesium chelatase subunit D
MPGAGAAMAGADGAGRPQVGEARPPGRPAEPAAVMEESFEVRRLDARLDRLVRKPAGRRSVTRSKTRRGRYVWAVPAESGRDDIAVDATLRAAALRQAPLPPGAGLQVTVQDLQRKVRMRRAGNVILFLVDASWSMATAGRLAAAKGAVLSLLVDAYQRRDRVGMAVFRRTGTDVVLPFTASVLQARRLLASIPVGGKTPLSHGLYTADELFRRVLRHDPTQLPLLVLLTDGAGNISLSGRPPTEETLLLADRIRRQGVRSVVIDLYSRVQLQPVSPAAALARALGGEHTSVESLHAGGVLEAVRARLDPLA